MADPDQHELQSSRLLQRHSNTNTHTDMYNLLSMPNRYHGQLKIGCHYYLRRLL